MTPRRKTKVKRARPKKPHPVVNLKVYDDEYFAVQTSQGLVCFHAMHARSWALFLAQYADWADSRKAAK